MSTVAQRLRQALVSRQKRRVANNRRVKSAVLLPIYYKEYQYYVLFTKRTEIVKEHKGQISFPGGAYQAEDGTLLNTALRESAEELGLRENSIEVLGELDDVVTQTSNYIIVPFVGVIPWPYQFVVNPGEIEEIIEAPVPALLDGGIWRQGVEIIDGEATATYFCHYQRWVIWGATAQILNQFLGILSQIYQ